MGKKDFTESPDDIKETKKSRPEKAKTFCVRAICPKCSARTFETIASVTLPQKNDSLDNLCKECGQRLEVISIYNKEN